VPFYFNLHDRPSFPLCGVVGGERSRLCADRSDWARDWASGQGGAEGTGEYLAG